MEKFSEKMQNFHEHSHFCARDGAKIIIYMGYNGGFGGGAAEAIKSSIILLKILNYRKF